MQNSIFDLFKKKPDERTPDVKSIRNELLQFIQSNLSKAEGGEGGAIKKLPLLIACSEEEKHLYEAALYANDEARFKEDVQKIADDSAITLPPHWELHTTFTAEL